MQVTCPRCKRSLSTAESEGPPLFCMYCGQKLRDSTPSLRGMLTASHVPFTDNPDVDAAEPPPEEVGGYRLLQFLGAGGMGAVYEAESIESGNRVAVKLLSSRLASNPGSVERFRQEGRLASQLAHPRCVFVLAADTDAGRPYIVMELMPGRTLKDVVDANGPLPVNDAIAYILDAIDGLAEAHRLGMIHRDVKPSNCFLTADDRVKVGDFGLSKSLADSADRRHLTQSGTFLGTVLFASPEQIRGEPLDYTSDIYSLCATLYFLLCGEAPFNHESATAALAKAVSEPPPPLAGKRPDVPAALERIVMRGLEREPDRRWQSLDELRDAMAELLPSRQTPARPRAIIGAYVIDYLLILLLLDLPHEVLHSIFQWRSAEVFGLDLRPVSWALTVAYFATMEGMLGRTIGKSLLGLRVVRVGQSGPPGLERAWIRAIAFQLIWFWTFHAPTITGKFGGLLALGTIASGIAMLLIQIRRTAEGYRGLHDLISGCHVVQKPLPVRRLRLPSRTANRLEGLLPPNETEPLPDTLGGFQVKGRLWTDSLGEQLWLAEDRVLARRVLLWVMPDDGNPATPIPSDVPRLTRLRRLGRGTMNWAGRSLEWVAFAAPVGAPLADTIRKPLPWADARQILEQLAEELQASETDGSLPRRLGLSQVWVEPNGRVQLLEFPISGGSASTSGAECTPLDLMRSVATLTLEGSPREPAPVKGTGHGVRAPVPLHAVPVLTRLFSRRGYSTVAELQANLKETHSHPPEVTSSIRTAHLGIQSALLSFGLLFMFSAAMLPGVWMVIIAQGRTKATVQTLKDLRDPAAQEELGKMLGVKPALNNPKAIARIESVKERLQKETDERRTQLLAPQRFLVEGWEQITAEAPLNSAQLLAAERELLIWAGANERSPAGKGETPWPSQSWPFWGVILGIPLIWVFSAAVFRGGPSMLLTGIAVVRSDGRRAYRRQCAWRAAIVWLPIVMLLIGSVWIQVYHFRLPYVAATYWIAAAVLLPVYFVIALKYPSRPPQDVLAGTHLVPV